MATRGLKRLCGSCGIKFYDLEKSPIICPSCDTKFTGEVVVKARRAKSVIVADTVKRENIEAKNLEAAKEEAKKEDEETASLEEKNDDGTTDDDLSGLEGDVEIEVKKETE